MQISTTRRALLAGGAALFAAPMLPQIALSADPHKVRFSAVFSEQDIRSEMMKRFSEAVKADIAFQGFYGGTLFKQGTELVALQRNNLEMSNIAPQDISKQVPTWSIVTSAYLFRDANHLAKLFASDVGAELSKLAEDNLGIKILGPTFYGTRHVGLRGKKKINTPADLKGVKLRMPGGEAWQFLGQSIGANPTPMAYAEVYTGLQTGAIDGQDNPIPNVQNMKFYEVMDQIVLTSHLIAFDLLVLSKKTWTALSPEQQTRVQKAATEAIAYSTEQHLAQETKLAKFFEEKGLSIYTPDIPAFRKHAQDAYLASDIAKDWPAGMLQRISAL